MVPLSAPVRGPRLPSSTVKYQELMPALHVRQSRQNSTVYRYPSMLKVPYCQKVMRQPLAAFQAQGGDDRRNVERRRVVRSSDENSAQVSNACPWEPNRRTELTGTSVPPLENSMCAPLLVTVPYTLSKTWTCVSARIVSADGSLGW